MNEHRNPRNLLDPRVLLLFVVLLGWALWPILLVCADSFWSREGGFSLEPWRRFLAEGGRDQLARSVLISLATVALAGAFGTALAFLHYRLDYPGRALFAGLALLPFTLPPLVGVFSIWTLFAEDGAFHLATRAIGLGPDGLWFEKGWGGVLLVHVYSMFVYFHVMVGGALAGFDESRIEAARDLGAGRLQTFRLVVLPALVPALAGASLLSFMTSMASFTAPYFYAPARPVLTVGIQQALEENDPARAAAACVALALCAAAFLALNARLETAMAAGVGSKGAARRPIRSRSRAVRWGLTALAAAISLALVAPHLAMARESLVKPGTGFIGRPLEYTFDNYAKLWNERRNWAQVGNSLRASLIATVAVVLFALNSAWLEARRSFPGKALARWLVMLPWALPGTVIGIGLLWITRAPGPLTFGAELRGTIAILALAYFIRLAPLGHRTIKAALLRAPEELEGAARDLGAGPVGAFARVTLLLILPAIIAAAALVFTTSMGEFVSSILLASHDNEPIAVKIDQVRRGPAGMQTAAAYGTLLVGMIAATFAAFGRSTRGGAGG